MNPLILTIKVHGIQMEVEFFYCPFRPGKLSGPPESCYPDTPEEFEILAIRIGDVNIEPLLNNFESHHIEDAIRKTLDEMQEEFGAE